MTDTQRYNTGNELGSNKLEDLSDNAKNIDNFSNSGNETFTDRLGVYRKTIAGMESDHDAQISANETEHDNQIARHETEHDNQIARHESEFINHIEAMGWTPAAGSFQAGGKITDRNQTLYDEVSHVFYSWGGVIPEGGYVVQAGSTPATAGGIGVDAWSDKTDLMLRSDINIVQKRFSCVSDMVADTSLYVGQIVETLGYHSEGDGGGNTYVIVPTGSGVADGGSYITLSSSLQAHHNFKAGEGIYKAAQFGVIADGATDNTTVLQLLLDKIKYGKRLELPNGIICFTNLTINGDYPSVGGFEIFGAGACSAYVIRGYLLGTYPAITGTTLKCTSSSGGFSIDGVLSDPSIYTKQIEGINIHDFNIIGSTSGNLFKTRRCTSGSSFNNISIVNSGTGYCHYLTDCYISSFNKIMLSGLNRESSGLYIDTYRVAGGLMEFNNCNIAYCDKGLILGSLTAGATGYGGLHASKFNQTQVHECNSNLYCGYVGDYSFSQNTQYTVFDTCYFELDKAAASFIFKNMCRLRFVKSYFSLVNTNAFTVGSSVAAENVGINLEFDGCAISTPLTGLNLMFLKTDTQAVIKFKDTSIKNNGASYFVLETANAFKGCLLFDGLDLINNNTYNLFSESSILRFIPYNSPQKLGQYKVSNTDIDFSSQKYLPAYVSAQTYSSNVNILLPILANFDVERGMEITVFKDSSSNAVIIDAGTGNTIVTANGVESQYASLATYGAHVTLKLDFNGTAKSWKVISSSPDKIVTQRSVNFTATNSVTFSIGMTTGQLQYVPKFANIVPLDIGVPCFFQYNYSASTTTALSFTAYTASGYFTAGVKNLAVSIWL